MSGQMQSPRNATVTGQQIEESIAAKFGESLEDALADGDDLESAESDGFFGAAELIHFSESSGIMSGLTSR